MRLCAAGDAVLRTIDVLDCPLRLPAPANAFHQRPRRLRVLTTTGGPG